MKIFLLEADGPHRANIGLFSSKKKADKAWRRFKYSYRGTVWQSAKKILTVEITDVDYDNRKV